MFKSIGFVIALAFTAHLFADAFTAFESATVATFRTIETAAELSEAQLIDVAAH